MRGLLVGTAFVAINLVGVSFAADCKVAIVGQPYSTCFDIYTAAHITAAQFNSYNPGLDCSKIQPGQKVCVSSGTLPSNAPKPSTNGTCYQYWPHSGDYCAAIAAKYDITVENIEGWNKQTWKWNGCASLQLGYPICLSIGNPPPIAIVPGTACGPESKGNATCPLNACCSAFGFCGFTDEFCSTKGPNPCISNCGTPTLPSCSPGTMRNMAYYAGWGARRDCGVNVEPSMIDWTKHTHAIFAFATFTQSYQIYLQDADAPLLKQLLAVKASNSNLKVLIAIGGWDFSELDATKDLFSAMISTAANRATFISSVKTFLSQNKLDGIDIDFEYPGAMERNAPASDTSNLTAFFKELRTALGSQIISCAAPAGYWFLKGFEIDKIASSVDFINMMSYDYHGQWDKNITGQPPVSNPHTSVLDITDSTLLYARAKIDLKKVNLGLAWYGRTYHITQSGCTGYNCTMDGGGFAGRCTITSGYLAQFEIDELIAKGANPTLDSKTQTYWIKSGDSVISFDQADTWSVKQKFAGDHCYGGYFVWSSDQNNKGLGAGSGGDSGGPNSSGQYSPIEWNPNPYPSPGQKSETFVQIAGVYTTTRKSVANAQTTTQTVVVTAPADTSTTTSWGTSSNSNGVTITSTTGTTVIPGTTSIVTDVVTFGDTVTTTQVVTKTSTTIVIPIPVGSTTVTLDDKTDGPIFYTVTKGGAIINDPIPPWISIPSATTPTWTENIIPPSSPTITFTAPLTGTPTWTSTVPLPPASRTSGVVVTGPPGGHNRCGNVAVNLWNLLPFPKISGCPPLDVGIKGGITPTPVPPPGWTGPWKDPEPLPTDPNEEESTSTTSTATESCAAAATAYDLPDDPASPPSDEGDEDVGDLRKKGIAEGEMDLGYEEESFAPQAGGRRIAVNKCSGQVQPIINPNSPTLGQAPYYHLTPQKGSSGTRLQTLQVQGRPGVGGATPQEHTFELGYINQFFTNSALSAVSCGWINDNVFKYTLADGSNLGMKLLQAIDNTNNMVWVDKALNQAKSNVVNNNRGTPGNPPQSANTLRILDFQRNAQRINNVEFFLRNFAALGQYFSLISGKFKKTAGDVQTLLSEVTPNSVPDSSKSLPLIFNEWLTDTVNEYPTGCTSRASNAYAFYRTHMQSVALTSNPPTVPQCYTLYNRNIFSPSSFVAQDLIPSVPAAARCNVPGTRGKIGYVSGTTTVKDMPFWDPNMRIMGSGKTDFYAVGSGNNIGGMHIQARLFNDFGPRVSDCDGVWVVTDLPVNTQLARPMDVAFNCGGKTGKLEAEFAFFVNGAALQCAQRTDGHAGGTTTNIYCATRQQDAVKCLGTGATAVRMRFFPA